MHSKIPLHCLFVFGKFQECTFYTQPLQKMFACYNHEIRPNKSIDNVFPQTTNYQTKEFIMCDRSGKTPETKDFPFARCSLELRLFPGD